jgi:uncharacterized coiled-coil DUF342 family protein
VLNSCSNVSEDNNTTDTSSIDSIINKSKENQSITNDLNKKSDSTVSGKVEATVKKIDHLETQVKQLKEENNDLKEKLLDATNDNGKPFRLEPVSPR